MSPTTRRCYLHVGLPKTGTSYLQSVMWASREALAAQGLELAMDRPVDHFHVTLALRGLLRSEMDPPHAFTALDRLAASVAQMAGPTILITHESLAPATPAQVDQLIGLLPDYEVHVVVTARDLARQIASGWQQRIQERQVHSYPEFLAAVIDRAPLAHDFWINQDLPQVTANWQTAVPAERLHLVTVPPAGSESSLLLERFCSVLGVEPTRLSTDTHQANPSLGHTQVELLRRVNLALGDRLPHARAGFARVGKRYLARQILAPQGGEPPGLPDAVSEWCGQRSEDIVKALAERGYDIVGDLADLLPAQAAEPARSEVSDADLAASAAAALADILVRRHLELDELQALRRQVRQQRQQLERPQTLRQQLAARVRRAVR